MLRDQLANGWTWDNSPTLLIGVVVTWLLVLGTGAYAALRASR